MPLRTKLMQTDSTAVCSTRYSLDLPCERSQVSSRCSSYSRCGMKHGAENTPIYHVATRPYLLIEDAQVRELPSRRGSRHETRRTSKVQEVPVGDTSKKGFPLCIKKHWESGGRGSAQTTAGRADTAWAALPPSKAVRLHRS